MILKQISHSHSYCISIHITEQSGSTQTGLLPTKIKAKKCPRSTSDELQALRDVQSIAPGSAWSKIYDTYVMWMPGSQHCVGLQSACFYRAPLLVNIHIATETEIQPSPGENSQSISAISRGLQLKALNWELIHCTWLYIIIVLLIINYSIFFKGFFPSFCWPACGGDAQHGAELCSVPSLQLPKPCAAEPLQLCCILGSLGWFCPCCGIHSTFPAHRCKTEETVQCLFVTTLEFLVSESCKNEQLVWGRREGGQSAGMEQL